MILSIVFQRVLIAMVVSIATAMSAQGATTRVTRDHCSFSFDYPDSWTAVENPEAAIEDPEHYKTIATCDGYARS